MAFSLLRPFSFFQRDAKPSRVGTVLEREKEMLEKSRVGVGQDKVRVSWGNNSVFSTYWWLPYHDSISGETAAMRSAYKQMLRCPTVKAGLLGKVLAGASLDWQIQPANPDSPRDLECCDFLRHCINRIPGGMPQLFQTLTLPRLIDGYSLSEPVLELERKDPKWDGMIVLNDVKQKHPDHYQITTDEYARPFAIEGRGPNQGDVWPLSDFIYSKYISLYDDPRGLSDLRAAYGAYHMRDTVTKLRAIGAEKWTNPFLMGTYKNQDDKSKAEDAMTQAKGNTWISIPDGVKIEAMSIAARGESDFKSFIDDCDKQILVALTGAYLQVLEGQVADGRGSASVSKSIAELFQWILLSLVQEDVNKFLFPRLVAYNYLGVRTPSLLFGGINEEEASKYIDNVIKAQQAGAEISKKEFYRRSALAVPTGPDDVMKPVAPTIPMGQPQVPAFSEAA